MRTVWDLIGLIAAVYALKCVFLGSSGIFDRYERKRKR